MGDFFEFSGISIFIILVFLTINIIILVRWWKMTTNIQYIRDYLYKNEKNTNKKSQSGQSISKKELSIPVKNAIDEEIAERVEFFKKKLKSNECIVKLNVTGKVEVWNKKDWEDAVEEGKEGRFFTLLYQN